MEDRKIVTLLLIYTISKPEHSREMESQNSKKVCLRRLNGILMLSGQRNIEVLNNSQD